MRQRNIQQAGNITFKINHNFRGVSTKYLQSYANWFAFLEELKNNTNGNSIDKALASNNQTWNQYTNLENIYKRFIENLSSRTYRCPVKRKWKSQIDYKSINYAGTFI